MKEKINKLLLEKRRYELVEKVSFIEKIKLFFNMPIQKIIGYVILADVKINIKKKVLIPRYETEELIYLTLKLINERKYTKILDLGCGSGFIGIALKKNNENLSITQTDIDSRSIKQTKKNLKINNINNLVLKSNIFSNLDKNNKFDVIVSNPPYLLKSEKKNINSSVLLYEPHRALFAKNNGMFFYENIENNLSYLNKNGLIIFEINPINSKWFIDRNYVIKKDINGKERFAYKFLDN